MPVDASKAQEQWDRFVYCRDSGHVEFLVKADKCDKFFKGEQWEKDDLAALKEARRPAMTINKIISTVGTVLGEQIFNRTEVLFRPKNGAKPETAEALTKVWLHVSQENQLPWARSDMFCDGIIRSRGFVDMRIKFDDNMQGEIEITNLNSKNVVIDPDAEGYDPDEWNDVFVTKWLSGQDISVLYNEDDAEFLSSRDTASYAFGYDSLDRVRDRFGTPETLGNASAFDSDKHMVRRHIRVLERQYRLLNKQLHFVDVETGDMRPIPHDWKRDKIAALLEKTGGRISTTKKLVKRIRWCVTADNVVLHDEWSPYQHFTVVPYFPYFRYGTTIGIVENLLGPQEILNKVSSQELHIVNTTANSGYVVEEDSLVNMTTEELEQQGAKTGIVLEYRKSAQPPQKIQPNQVPTGLDRISSKAEDSIKNISNVSDSMQGFDRADVAAKAIAYKTQRGSVNMTKIMDNLERTDYILARNGIDLIQAFYTEPRLINITHSDITRESEQVSVNQQQQDPATGEMEIINDLTLGEFDITITTTPARASIEDTQFEQARGLREIGVQIPDSVLIENSRLSRRAEIIKQMTGDKESPEMQAQMQMQQRTQEAQVAGLEADVADKQADTQLKLAKVQELMQNDGQQAQQEMGMKREEMSASLEFKVAELELKQKEMERKLELQQEAHQLTMRIKQQEAEQNAKLREEDAVAKRAQMLRTQQTGGQGGRVE